MLLYVMQSIQFKDFMLLSGLFALYIFITGSLLHLFERELEYHMWATKQTSKRTRTSNRAATKRSSVNRTTRKAKPHFALQATIRNLVNGSASALIENHLKQMLYYSRTLRNKPTRSE